MMVHLNRHQADLLRRVTVRQEGSNVLYLEEANLEVVRSLMFLNCVRIGPRRQLLLTVIGGEYYRELFR